MLHQRIRIIIFKRGEESVAFHIAYPAGVIDMVHQL